MEKRIYIPLPNFESRKELIRINLKTVEVYINLCYSNCIQAFHVVASASFQYSKVHNNFLSILVRIGNLSLRSGDRNQVLDSLISDKSVFGFELIVVHKHFSLIMQQSQVAADVNIDEVARRTEGYSGDDLTNVCRDASMNGMRRKIAGKTRDEIKNMSKDEISKDPVAMCDFEEALAKVQRSVSAADIEKHEKWFSEFGSA